MPELDLGDLSGTDLTVQPRTVQHAVAGLRLWAYVAWPDDERRRLEFVVTRAARELEELKRRKRIGELTHAQFEAAQRPVTFEFESHGGLGPMIEAPGLTTLHEEMRRKERQWYVAGMVLCLIMTIQEHYPDVRGGASVNKAIRLMEDFARENRKVLWQYWSEKKAISHVCGAIVYLTHLVSQRPKKERHILIARFFFEDIGLLLGYARRFQEFATSYRAHGQNSPLLEPSEIWTVPDSLKLPAVSIKPAPLPPAQLAALRKYQAPVHD